MNQNAKNLDDDHLFDFHRKQKLGLVLSAVPS